MGKIDKPKRQLLRPWTKIHILEWCEYRRISQAELARRTGLSEGMISQIVNGQANGAPESLEKIAAALNIPLGYLLDMEPRKGGQWVAYWVPDRHLATVHMMLTSLGAVPAEGE